MKECRRCGDQCEDTAIVTDVMGTIIATGVCEYCAKEIRQDAWRKLNRNPYDKM